MRTTGSAFIVMLAAAGITAAALTVGTGGFSAAGQSENAVAVFGVL